MGYPNPILEVKKQTKYEPNDKQAKYPIARCSMNFFFMDNNRI